MPCLRGHGGHRGPHAVPAVDVGAMRGVRGASLPSGSSGGDGAARERGVVHRGSLYAPGRGRGAPAGTDRRGVALQLHSEGPPRHRARLPPPRAAVALAFRRRGAARQAYQVPRARAAQRRAPRPGRALHGASPAGHPRLPRRACRHRARRGHGRGGGAQHRRDTRRGLVHRPRPGGRPARRARCGAGDARRAPVLPGVRNGASPEGRGPSSSAAEDPRITPRAKPGHQDPGCSRQQPRRGERDDTQGQAHGGNRRFRLGQVEFGPGRTGSRGPSALPRVALALRASGTREGPEAEVDAVRGLGVTVAVSSRRWSFGLRADVGWATEISRHLAVLFACHGGIRWCPSCDVAMSRPGEGGPWRCPASRSSSLPCAPSTSRFRATARHARSATASAPCRCRRRRSSSSGRRNRSVTEPCTRPASSRRGTCAGRETADTIRFGPSRSGTASIRATPWSRMTEAARQAFLFGDPEPLNVTFRGKSGRVRTSTVTYRVILRFRGRLGRGGGNVHHGGRVPGVSWLAIAPRVRGRPSRRKPDRRATADGAGRAPRGAALGRARRRGGAERARASALTVHRRLEFLREVGLGHLDLGRIASTLSAEKRSARAPGRHARERAHVSDAALLDEPTRGLHPREVGALAGALEELRDDGNTVVVVEHDLELVRRADLIIEMGPGAGRLGGRVVAQGTPGEIAAGRGPTARWLRARGTATAGAARPRRRARDWLVIRGPHENNLDGADVRIPLGFSQACAAFPARGRARCASTSLPGPWRRSPSRRRWLASRSSLGDTAGSKARRSGSGCSTRSRAAWGARGASSRSTQRSPRRTRSPLRRRGRASRPGSAARLPRLPGRRAPGARHGVPPLGQSHLRCVRRYRACRRRPGRSRHAAARFPSYSACPWMPFGSCGATTTGSGRPSMPLATWGSGTSC